MKLLTAGCDVQMFQILFKHWFGALPWKLTLTMEKLRGMEKEFSACDRSEDHQACICQQVLKSWAGTSHSLQNDDVDSERGRTQTEEQECYSKET